MTNWLKQSTAVIVSFGPFVDKADGVTLETGLVSALDHASTGIFLSKNGGALTIRHATVTATTYDAYGMYRVTLDTTDTNTLGTLRMAFSEAATCLPVWQDFMVVPANVWDSMFGADKLQVHVDEMTAGIITATVIADNAIDAGAFAADAITAAKIAADAGTEIGTAVWATAARTLTAATNVTSTGAAVPITAGGLVSADVTAISTDTTAANNAESFFDGTGYAGGTTKLGVDVVAISGDTTAADNAELMFDGTGYAGGTTKLGVDVVAISGDTTAADNLELMYDGTGYAGGTTKLAVNAVALSGSTAAADNAEAGYTGIVTGTAITGTLSTTAFTTNLTEATDDHYNGRIITFTSGVLAGQQREITDYNGTTKTITVAAMTDAPSNTDAFFIA